MPGAPTAQTSASTEWFVPDVETVLPWFPRQANCGPRAMMPGGVDNLSSPYFHLVLDVNPRAVFPCGGTCIARCWSLGDG